MSFRYWTHHVVLVALLLGIPHGCSLRGRAPTQRLPAGNGFLFTSAGDMGTGPEASATLDVIARSGAAFHLALGDLAYNREPESMWCNYVISKVGARFPFQLLAGNHEEDFGEAGHITNFVQCLPDKIGVTGEYGIQYYFDYNGLARFILISPDLTIGGRHYYYGDGNANYQWVARTIDDARAAGMRWVIVGMHKSCLSMGPYYCNIYADLMNLLIDRKVDLILQAHDHSYQRTKQLATGSSCKELAIDSFDPGCIANGDNNSYAKGRGTIQVIVGTGGQPLYEINRQDSEAGYFVRWMGENASPRNGVLGVAVTEGQLRAEFIGSTKTSKFSDRFLIKARNSSAVP